MLLWITHVLLAREKDGARFCVILKFLITLPGGTVNVPDIPFGPLIVSFVAFTKTI